MPEKVFTKLMPQETLYPASPGTYRRRWDLLLSHLGVPKSIGLTPGALRGGGAVFSYHEGAQISEILWLMRLKSLITLESYLQETAALNVMQQLPNSVQSSVQPCFSQLFGAILHSSARSATDAQSAFCCC